jgi:anti-anti-sigma factor
MSGDRGQRDRPGRPVDSLQSLGALSPQPARFSIEGAGRKDTTIVSRFDQHQGAHLQGLTVARSRRGDRHVLHLHGELDVANVATLQSELLQLEADDCDGIVFDLRGLDFLDSTGIHLLAEAHRRASGRGRKVAVAVSEGVVRRVLQVSGMLDVLVLDELEAEVA